MHQCPFPNKPLHLILDSAPAPDKAAVNEYVASTQGKLTLHFLPGYAPDLNPDELVWSHAKHTDVKQSERGAGVSGRVRRYAKIAAGWKINTGRRHSSLIVIKSLA
jgi:transposase